MRTLSAILFFLFCSHFSLATELKPYQVYIKPGSVLTRLSDKKNVSLPKGIYAYVLETSPTRREIFVVYDKNGKPAYETTSHGIVEIDKDIQILPNVDAEISYPPPSTLKSDNKEALFDTQFNLHLDQLQMSAVNSIYSQELETAFSNRYELRTMYVSELPINFGLGLNYQIAYWENDVDEVKLSALSFGPQLQRYIYAEETMAISLFIGAEYAPLYRTSSGSSVENFKAMLLDIGTEIMWETYFGKWSLGAHYRRHDLTLTSSTRPGVDVVPEELVINSIGAMVGYKYEWDL